MFIGSGPWAHLISGNHEQTFVAGLCEFALCIGDYSDADHCNTKGAATATAASDIITAAMLIYTMLSVLY